MATATERGNLSYAADVVSRSIILFDDNPTGRDGPGEEALIIAYEPGNNTHTVAFQETGKRKVLLLHKYRFKFVEEKKREATPGILAEEDEDHVAARNLSVAPTQLSATASPVAAESCDPEQRRIRAAQRDAVGRKVKYRCPIRKTIIHGRIKAFYEQTRYHSIELLLPGGGARQIVNLDLQDKKVEWRYTDLIGDGSRGARTNIATSKYVGVRRTFENSWTAYISQYRKQSNWIGTFAKEKDAALAHDFYARQLKRTNPWINFPNERLTEEQVKLRMSIAHAYSKPPITIKREQSKTSFFSFNCSRRERTSRFRGVSWDKNAMKWHARCSMKKVTQRLCRNLTKDAHLGFYDDEREAALSFDKTCRKFGVPEIDLNFPRDHKYLKKARLFDNECYKCFRQSPVNAVATPCNHIFCRRCISEYLKSRNKCPCCQYDSIDEMDLRSVSPIQTKTTNGSRKRKRESVADPEKERNDNNDDTTSILSSHTRPDMSSDIDEDSGSEGYPCEQVFLREDIIENDNVSKYRRKELHKEDRGDTRNETNEVDGHKETHLKGVQKNGIFPKYRIGTRIIKVCNSSHGSFGSFRTSYPISQLHIPNQCRISKDSGRSTSRLVYMLANASASVQGLIVIAACIKCIRR